MTRVFPAKLCGSVNAPPSKSCSHRALICAALSDSPVRLEGLSKCDDVMLTLACLKKLGAVYKDGIITPIDRGSLPTMPTLDCGESGSTLRFLLPIVAALGCGASFHMGSRLSQRPIEALCDELSMHGVEISRHGNMLNIEGRLVSGTYTLPGNISSQFISGMLFALPLIGGGEVYITNEAVSRNYIEITKDYLIRSNIYVNQIAGHITVSGDYSFESVHRIESDWSAAAYWLCAAALGADVSVRGLECHSRQGDRAIVDILSRMGARVGFENGISVTATRLKPIGFNAASVPDLVPCVSLLCAVADGESHICGAASLRTKESDRLEAIYIMLTSMGVDVKLTEDGLIIRGGAFSASELKAFSDHRIAMAELIAAAFADGNSTVDDIDCISKSYPEFTADYMSLGGLIL